MTCLNHPPVGDEDNVIPEGPSGAIEQLPVANLRKERLFRDQLDPLQVPDELLLR